MLSKLVRVPAATRSLRSPALGNLRLVRLNSAIAAAPSVGDSNLGSIAKYGFYPFAGALATVLISKEFIHINEEWVLAGNFVLFSFAAYCYIGDSVGKMFDQQRAADEARLSNAFSTGVLVCESAIEEIKRLKFLPEVLKNIKTEQAEVAKLVAEADVWRARHAARAATIAKLEEIKAVESRAASRVKGELASQAGKWVREQYAKAPAQLRASILSNNVASIGSSDQPKEDEIKKLFVQFFEKRASGKL